MFGARTAFSPRITSYLVPDDAQEDNAYAKVSITTDTVSVVKDAPAGKVQMNTFSMVRIPKSILETAPSCE